MKSLKSRLRKQEVSLGGGGGGGVSGDDLFALKRDIFNFGRGE